MTVEVSPCVPPGATKLSETSISLAFENALSLSLFLGSGRWFVSLTKKPKKASESLMSSYYSFLFITVICGWKEFILIFFFVFFLSSLS